MSATISTVCARTRRNIGAHFAGDSSPRREQPMREHVLSCNGCKEYYERRMLLAKLDPRAVPRKVRLARGLGFHPGTSRTSRAIISFLAPAAIAASIGVVITIRDTDKSEFTSRGSTASSTSLLRVCTLEPGVTPKLDTNTIARDQELAFVYRNHQNKKHLMVFAIDVYAIDEQRAAQPSVYWFQPAWTEPSENPVSIAIKPDGPHELRDAVKHHFKGNTVRLVSVFLDNAVSVLEVEQLLAKEPGRPLPLAGAIESSILLGVEP